MGAAAAKAGGGSQHEGSEGRDRCYVSFAKTDFSKIPSAEVGECKIKIKVRGSGQECPLYTI